MYIISKFHDYYDAIIGVTGIDKKTVFNRSQEVYEVSQLKSDFQSDRMSTYRARQTTYFMDKHVPLCKVLALPYTLYIVDSVYTGYCFVSDNFPVDVKYSYDSRKVKLDMSNTFNVVNDVSTTEGYLLFNPDEIVDFLTRLNHSENQIKKFIKEPKPVDRSVFKEVGSPVFMVANNLLSNSFFKFMNPVDRQRYIEHSMTQYSSTIIVTNPNLSQLGIPLMIDAFKLFQEISMYIADINNIEVTSFMSDVEKRNAKGFDDKSFKHRK